MKNPNGKGNKKDNFPEPEPVQKVPLRGFRLAKEYQHLANAPLGEFETCDMPPLIKVDLTGATNSSSNGPGSAPGKQGKSGRKSRKRPKDKPE